MDLSSWCLAFLPSARVKGARLVWRDISAAAIDTLFCQITGCRHVSRSYRTQWRGGRMKHAEELGIGFVGAGAVAELHHLALQGISSAKLVALPIRTWDGARTAPRSGAYVPMR